MSRSLPDAAVGFHLKFIVMPPPLVYRYIDPFDIKTLHQVQGKLEISNAPGKRDGFDEYSVILMALTAIDVAGVNVTDVFGDVGNVVSRLLSSAGNRNLGKRLPCACW